MNEHQEGLLYQESMNTIIAEQEYKVFAMLKPKIFKDGNNWCVLYGRNIQDGVAGFGSSPYKAMLNWNQAWYEEIGNERRK